MKLNKSLVRSATGLIPMITFGLTLLVSSCQKAESFTPDSSLKSSLSDTSASISSKESSFLTNGVPSVKISDISLMATSPVKTYSYVESKPLTYTGKNNFTISGVSITAGSVPAITLNNCINVHIKLSRFVNGTSVNGVGIYLYKCQNVTIEDSYFGNLASGVYASLSTMVYVANNQMRNMKGPMPRGQFVQLNQCYGGGNKIMGNKFENVMGQSSPEDAINIYQSSGTSSSPITVAYNWIRGGGPSNSGGGIALGDDGGSYQTAFENVLVNPGQYGIAIASGKSISVLNNKIYGAKASFTNVGTFAWNQYSSSSPCSLITIAGNEVNFTASAGHQNSSWNGGNCGTISGWNNNKWGSSDVTATILPTNIIDRN